MKSSGGKEKKTTTAYILRNRKKRRNFTLDLTRVGPKAEEALRAEP